MRPAAASWWTILARGRPPPAQAAPSTEETLALWDRHADNLILWLDADLQPRRASSASQALLGIPPQALLAQGLPVTPQDIPALQALLASARSHRVTAPTRLRVRHHNGGLIWLDIRAASDGRGGAILTARDATALHRAEAQLAAARQQIAAMGLTDPLTGLANLRRFNEALAQEHRRASRDAQPLSLLALVPDQFAAYCDRFGHVQGEAALRRIAQTVAATLQRPADLAARGDAEELLILLPNTNALGGTIVAGRIRRAVRALHIAHAGTPAGILTVAVGLAWIDPGTPPEALISAARAARRPDSEARSDEGRISDQPRGAVPLALLASDEPL